MSVTARRRSCSALLGLAFGAAALTACSGDVDVDPDALREGFRAGAETAYEAEGKSRAEDYQNGVRTDCFALDDEAVDEIGDAVGVDAVRGDGDSTLYGAEEREQLSCQLLVDRADERAERAFVVTVGTTEADLEALVEARTDPDNPGADTTEVLERGADGLEDEFVVGFRDDGSVTAVYAADGIVIAIGGSSEQLDAAAAFEALPVVVEEVGRVLG